MKISKIFLVGFTSAADERLYCDPMYHMMVPSCVAIFSLNDLEKVSSEVFSNKSINKRSSWKEKWIKKFRLNSQRMRGSFERCGTTDRAYEEQINVDYNSDNLCGTIQQVTTGLSTWTDRYISSCKGQKKNSHQKNRMIRWEDMLNKGKGFNFYVIRIFEQSYSI